MKAHQKKIKEERAQYAAQEDLFGAWWERLDLSKEKAEVKEVDYNTAKKIIY